MCECLEYDDGSMHLCECCADIWRKQHAGDITNGCQVCRAVTAEREVERVRPTRLYRKMGVENEYDACMKYAQVGGDKLIAERERDEARAECLDIAAKHARDWAGDAAKWRQRYETAERERDEARAECEMLRKEQGDG